MRKKEEEEFDPEVDAIFEDLLAFLSDRNLMEKEKYEPLAVLEEKYPRFWPPEDPEETHRWYWWGLRDAVARTRLEMERKATEVERRERLEAFKKEMGWAVMKLESTEVD